MAAGGAGDRCWRPTSLPGPQSPALCPSETPPLLDFARNPTASYLRLHRATCFHIQRWEGKRLTDLYIKICSDEKDDLAAWALAKVRGTLNPCRSCNP